MRFSKKHIIVITIAFLSFSSVAGGLLFAGRASAQDASVGCYYHVKDRQSINGYVYQTIKTFITYNGHHRGWTINANCMLDSSNVLNYNGYRANAVWLGHAAGDGSGYRDRTTTQQVCSQIPTSPQIHHIATCTSLDGSYSVAQDDASYMVLNNIHIVHCSGMGPPGRCGPGIYDNGATFPSPGSPIPHNPRAYRGAGSWDYGTQDFTPLFNRDGESYLAATPLNMRAQNTWPDGYGAEIVMTFRYIPTLAYCQMYNVPSVVNVNQSFQASIHFGNSVTSGMVWNPAQGYRIGSQNPQDNSIWGTGRLPITGVIPPGGISWGGPYNFTAPSTPGTYAFSWRMLQENVRWFGDTCTQYITVVSPPPPPITIRGRVWNIATGANYGNVRLDTCGHGSPTTASNGTFSFTVPQGSGFCIRVASGPAGAWGSPRIRPWDIAPPGGDNYGSACPAYTNTNYTGNGVTADYCGAGSYEYQIAGQHYTGPPSGSYHILDRASDSGYDIVYDNPPPKALCSISASPSSLEVGRPFSITITVDRRSISHTAEPPINNSGSGGAWRAELRMLPTPGLSGLPGGSLEYGTVQPGGTGSTGPIAGIMATSPGVYTLQAELRNLPGMPGGRAICNSSSDPSSPPTTIEVGHHSYLKTYGGEVATGGTFHSDSSTACGPTSNGAIHAWAELRGADYVGASAQLTVSSLMEINQFFSAGQRPAGSPPTAPKGLTFANVGSADANSTFGGGGGRAYCLTDYFNTTREGGIDQGGWNGTAGLPGGAGRVQYDLNGNTIVGTTIPVGTQAAVYVDGNVSITGNIQFATGAADWEHMPNFVLVVRGNLYIDPSVTRLDGIYIVQPDTSGGRGRVYTCANGNGTTIAPAQIHDRCGSQLVINGSLIAQQVRFLRTRGTLSNASARELPNSANIAEVIRFTPETYLSPSPLHQPGTTLGGGSAGISPGEYDSLKTLPPVF